MVVVEIVRSAFEKIQNNHTKNHAIWIFQKRSQSQILNSLRVLAKTHLPNPDFIGYYIYLYTYLYTA